MFSDILFFKIKLCWYQHLVKQIFFLKLFLIFSSITLDPDPNKAKILNPDPNRAKIQDPQHWCQRDFSPPFPPAILFAKKPSGPCSTCYKPFRIRGDIESFILSLGGDYQSAFFVGVGVGFGAGNVKNGRLRQPCTNTPHPILKGAGDVSKIPGTRIIENLTANFVTLSAIFE